MHKPLHEHALLRVFHLCVKDKKFASSCDDSEIRYDMYEFGI